MATITMPSSPGFKSIRPKYRRASTIAASPYNFTQQVYSWPGKIKVVSVELPEMVQSDAENWSEFFDDLNGFENTFNMDLSDAYPHETGLTTVAMRLVNPDAEWDINTLVHYGFSFEAMEAL